MDKQTDRQMHAQTPPTILLSPYANFSGGKQKVILGPLEVGQGHPYAIPTEESPLYIIIPSFIKDPCTLALQPHG